MTTHYIDIRVISDPETGAPQLMGVLCEKLHLALARGRIDSIGISFPEYSVIPKTLGTTLRLYGTEASLLQLQQTDWLKGLRDYVRVTVIAKVPDDSLHRIIQRKQFKTSVERLRRRRIRRHGESGLHVKKENPDKVNPKPPLPYIQMRSRSTGQSFYLYITMSETKPQPVLGKFNAYGLSTYATVPWF